MGTQAQKRVDGVRSLTAASTREAPWRHMSQVGETMIRTRTELEALSKPVVSN